MQNSKIDTDNFYRVTQWETVLPSRSKYFSQAKTLPIYKLFSILGFQVLISLRVKGTNTNSHWNEWKGTSLTCPYRADKPSTLYNLWIGPPKIGHNAQKGLFQHLEHSTALFTLYCNGRQTKYAVILELMHPDESSQDTSKMSRQSRLL